MKIPSYKKAVRKKDKAAVRRGLVTDLDNDDRRWTLRDQWRAAAADGERWVRYDDGEEGASRRC